MLKSLQGLKVEGRQWDLVSTRNTYGNFKCKKESVGEASPTPSNYEMMYSNHCGT